MSSRTVTRSARACVALAVVVSVGQPGSALAQVGDQSSSSLRLASEQTSAPGLAADAFKRIDCGSPGTGVLLSCVPAALDTAIQTAGPQPISGMLTLRDAIQRALEYNLTILGFTQAVGERRGQEQVARSRLRPNITGEFSAYEQRINLAAMGLTFNIPVPGFQLDHASGPFGVLDARASVSQAVLDLSALRTHKAATESVRASELSLNDARDLITLAVARAYLQAQAARARVETTRAQVETAKATHDRAVRQQAVGLVTPLGLNQANVDMLTIQQRLITLEAAYAKQKIDLARLSGLPPTDQYDLDESAPFSPGPQLSLDEAVKQALAGRADLQAADAQVRSAELSLSAAHGERLPTVTLRGDYGVSKAEKRSAIDTYIVAAMVSVPVWEGGRIDGQVQNAVATLNRRRAEREDLRAQIDADVRKAYVDLEAAAAGVKVKELSVQVTRDTLNFARQRFDAGVSDDVAVVRSQESMSTAEFDYIDSVLVHSLAKVDLARAIGGTAGNIQRFLGVATDGR